MSALPEIAGRALLWAGHDLPDWADSETVDELEERTAIMEHDGGLDRADAELSAFAEVVCGEVLRDDR